MCLVEPRAEGLMCSRRHGQSRDEQNHKGVVLTIPRAIFGATVVFLHACSGDTNGDPDAGEPGQGDAGGDTRLVITETEVDPSEVDAGDAATIYAMVQNRGEEDGEIILQLEVDGDVVDENEVEVPAPGDAQAPDDTEVVSEFLFVPEEVGEYELSVSGEEVGTLTVVEAGSNDSAFSSYEIASQTATLDAGEFDEFTTACPEEVQEALFGGIRSIGSDGQEPATRVQYSAPGRSGDSSAWVVGVSNVGEEAEEVETYAVCAEPPPDFDIDTEDFVIGAGTYEEEGFACAGEDRVPLGGGVDFRGTGEPDTRIEYGSPMALSSGAYGWEHGISNHASERREMQTIVLCAKAPEGYWIYSSREVLDRQFEEFQEACLSADPVVISGGANSGDTETRIASSYPDDVTASTWHVGMSNETVASPEVITYAVCADAPD